MRRNLPTGSFVPTSVKLQPWITLDQSGVDINSTINALVQKSYAGEQIASQAGVTITNIGGAMIAAEEASEAFDEPLTKAQVEDIVTPFIV
jgi:dephospho-CoA kinase